MNPRLRVALAPARRDLPPTLARWRSLLRGDAMTAVVQAVEVHRNYLMGGETVHAVNGVSLEIEAGEYVAIVGPSGCGKSTLLNLFGAIDRPSSGTVAIQGRRIDAMSEAEATRFRLLTIGFVFQRFYLMPTLSAGENVELPMAEAKVAKVDRQRRVRELLMYVG